jgi:3-hydroxyisobutyrate dehydrogenase-like beta-hydroxyacid dehydrogenase
MGSALAATLIERGYQVTVWNRTKGKGLPLVEAGASQVSTPQEAIAASDVTLVCIQSHRDTLSLLREAVDALPGKTVIELSTGDTGDAKELSNWLTTRGADCLIGMISTFPQGIGRSDAAIVTVGPAHVWRRCEEILRVLAGKSSYLGTDVGSLAALFAALFLPRQGFMFGLIYGALICEQAGISMADYVEQIPLAVKVVHDYLEVFASTVPSGDFADPPASLETYAASFRDVLNTFKAAGVRHELPDLFSSLVQEGVEAGLGKEQLTALTKVL